MSEWKGTTIENIADVKTGPYGSALLNAQYVRGGTPVITVEHIKDFRICQLDYPSVSEEDKARLASYTLEEGDIVFSRVGSVDLSAIAKKENVGWLFSSRMLRVRPNRKKIDPFFLSYYLRLHEVRNYIKKIAVGSTMPSINTEILKSIPVYHFDVEEQKEIAKTLSKLDDKITLLRQQNQTLEELAQTLFKRWFVEFEFPFDFAQGKPDENGRPYKSSGGKMVESELGEIPEGWRVYQINNLTSNIQYGFTQSSSEEEVGPKFLRITDIQGGKIDWLNVPYCEINEKELNKYRLTNGDIVVARTGASTGENLYIHKCPDAVFASYLVRFQFENKSVGRIIGLLMRTNYYKQFVKNILGGSAQPNANAQQLSEAEIVLPINEELLFNFYSSIFKIDDKMYNNQDEIQTLIQLRDTLLPKLMSGEVRVNV